MVQPLMPESCMRAHFGYLCAMPVDPEKTARLAVNVPVELAEKVKALAAAERRSVASWLRNAIEDCANNCDQGKRSES